MNSIRITVCVATLSLAAVAIGCQNKSVPATETAPVATQAIKPSTNDTPATPPAATGCSVTFSGAVKGTFPCIFMSPRFNHETGKTNVMLTLSGTSADAPSFSASFQLSGKMAKQSYSYAPPMGEANVSVRKDGKAFHSVFDGKPSEAVGGATYAFTDLGEKDAYGDIAYSPHGTLEAKLADDDSSDPKSPTLVTVKATF